MAISEEEIEKHFVELGKRIAFVRENKELKAYEVADKLNMDYSSYTRIEKGRTNPTYRTLVKIADALEVPVKEIVDYK